MESDKIITDILTIVAGKTEVYIYEQIPEPPRSHVRGECEISAVKINQIRLYSDIPQDKLCSHDLLQTDILANFVANIVHEYLHGAIYTIYRNGFNPHLAYDVYTQNLLKNIVQKLETLPTIKMHYTDEAKPWELATCYISAVTRCILSKNNAEVDKIKEKDPDLIKWLEGQLFPMISECAGIIRAQQNYTEQQVKLTTLLSEGMGFNNQPIAATGITEDLILELLGVHED